MNLKQFREEQEEIDKYTINKNKINKRIDINNMCDKLILREKKKIGNSFCKHDLVLKIMLKPEKNLEYSSFYNLYIPMWTCFRCGKALNEEEIKDSLVIEYKKIISHEEGKELILELRDIIVKLSEENPSMRMKSVRNYLQSYLNNKSKLCRVRKK